MIVIFRLRKTGRRLAEWQIAQVIDDDAFVAQQFLGQPAAAASGFFLLQLIDETDKVVEPAAGFGADNGRSDGNALMRLAGTGGRSLYRVARVWRRLWLFALYFYGGFSPWAASDGVCFLRTGSYSIGLVSLEFGLVLVIVLMTRLGPYSFELISARNGTVQSTKKKRAIFGLEPKFLTRNYKKAIKTFS